MTDPSNSANLRDVATYPCYRRESTLLCLSRPCLAMAEGRVIMSDCGVNKLGGVATRIMAPGQATAFPIRRCDADVIPARRECLPRQLSATVRSIRAAAETAASYADRATAFPISAARILGLPQRTTAARLYAEYYTAANPSHTESKKLCHADRFTGKSVHAITHHVATPTRHAHTHQYAYAFNSTPSTTTPTTGKWLGQHYS